MPNIYLIFFGLLFLLVFLLFNWGIFILLLSKGETEKMEKGRRILFLSFIFFIIVLLALLIFYLIKGKEIITPEPGELGEFPYHFHIKSDYPPGPEFIKLGKYYFAGPMSLKDNYQLYAGGVYAVLCKKEKEYDIIYIDDKLEEKLSENEKYNCWLDNCEGGLNNLYLALFNISQDSIYRDKSYEIKNKLNFQTSPSCLESQDTENQNN